MTANPIKGTFGDDNLTGTSGNDIFNLTRGGNDTVHAGGGNDIFWMGATLNAGDKLDGGDGIDQVNLNGDYSAGLVFAADTIANIEKLYLAAGHDYNLTLNDGNVAAGARLMVNAQALAAGNSLTFDGSAERDGHFNIFAGAGDDTITGGAAGDMIHLDKGGEDTVHAGGGNDTIFLGDTLDPADVIDGGSGRDTVILSGLGDDQITFSATTMTNVEVLQLDPGTFSYEIITDDATVAAGAVMTVDGSALSGSHAFHFDGSAETDGAFHFIAGTSLQTILTGGQGNDVFDLTHVDSTALTQVDGQGGNDVFQFLANFDSSSQTVDGGTGANTLSLNGDYSFVSLVGTGIIDNIQTVTLGGGHSYTGVQIFDDVSGGGALTIDATGLLAGDTLALDASASTDALIVRAGDGTYTLTGSAQNDTFFMGAHFKAADSIDGGGGLHDILVLDGDYTSANALVMGAATVTNVHSLLLLNHSYDITTADATVASGALMNINASNLVAGQALTFDGSAETDGSFQIVGGAGNDVLTGGQFGDLYDLSHGGNDTVHAGDGVNEFDMGAALTAADSINGGNGPDGMFLDGDYTGAHAVTFGAATVTGIDYLAVAAGHSYVLTANDATLDDAGLMSVDGSALGASDSLHFDGSAETAGSYALIDGLGNDVLIGGGGTDLLSFDGGGTDVGKGGGGDDFVDACGHLDSADQFDGGTGTDSIELTASETSTGNYTGANALHLTAAMMANFEQMDLDGGGSYDITTVDANVASGVSFEVDASFLGTGDSLTFDGSAETDGSFNFLDGAGNDALTGGALADTFDISGGGNDVVHGNGGNDQILATGTGVFTAADSIDGGSGNDTLVLSGDYSAGVTFSATTVVNVEEIDVDGGHSYNLTTNDATVANLQSLTVDASDLLAADSLTFDGAAETDGSFAITDGAGNDALTGGAQGDQFLLKNGGTDTVHGGGGDDSIFAFGTLTAADTIDGGTGSNQLHLFGDYTGANALVMGATTVTNVSSISFTFGFSYDITTNDATVAADQTLQVNAQTNAGDTVTFDGSAETDGHFSMLGGPGTDIFTGGALSDSFDMSNGGDDTVHGGGGNDTFNMGAAFTAAEQIDGGTGANTLALTGAYSGLDFNAADADNIQTIQFLGGFVESGITLTGDIAGGAAFLVINGFGAASLNFDGSGETGTTQFTIDGSAGDDVLTGGANNDGFNLTAGGNDTAHGGAGNDTFSFGAAFTASDTVDGGANTDTISLSGDYSAGVVFGATTMVNVENLVFNPGHDYKVTLNDANIGAGDALTVNVAALSGHVFTVNGSAESDGHVIVTAGAAFSASDVFTGGNDAGDLLILNGDYSPGLTFGATTMTGVEEIELGGGFSYHLTTDDATVASAASLIVDASALSGGDTLVFDGSAETNGTFTFDVDSAQVLADSQIKGGAGDDTLVLNGDFSGGVSFGSSTIHSIEAITLTAGNSYSLDLGGDSVAAGATISIDGSALGEGEHFDFGFDTLGGGGASYTLTGGAGDDAFFMLDAFKASDKIDGGGGGNDEIQLNGDYSAGVIFNADTIKNIGFFGVLNGNSYSLTENDGNVAAGATMGVTGSILGAANYLHFDGSAETDGHFQLIGGAGSDILIGGAQSDFLTGNGGADTLTGGGGADTFTYISASESTSTTYDTITDFASGSDTFALPVSVSQVFTASGSLDSGASFDSELAGLDIVHIHGATVLTVTGGTLNGHVFLVVDGDGNATYDAGSDYVFDITGHTGTIATGDFI